MISNAPETSAHARIRYRDNSSPPPLAFETANSAVIANVISDPDLSIDVRRTSVMRLDTRRKRDLEDREKREMFRKPAYQLF